MRKSVPQFAIIREHSASTFEEMLNTKLIDLGECDPAVTFSEMGDDMIARIAYREQVEYKPADMPMSESGIRLTCADCPMLEPIRKENGEIDGRYKYGNCPHTTWRAYMNNPACDVLYVAIKNGGIRLCLAE